MTTDALVDALRRIASVELYGHDVESLRSEVRDTALQALNEHAGSTSSRRMGSNPPPPHSRKPTPPPNPPRRKE